MTPWCDVLIPIYNNADLAKRCIDSVHKHADSGVRVLALDNGSSEHLSIDPNDNWSFSPDNLGFVKGTNLLLARSTAPFVMFLNSDTEVYEGCFERLRYHLEANPNCGAVGPITSPNAHSWQNVTSSHLDPHLRGVSVPGVFDHVDHVEMADRLATGKDKKSVVSGMIAFFCVMFPRKTIDTVGYLDERFGVGFGDDDDYCERIKKAGMEVRIALDTYVFHNHRATFKSLYSDEQIKEMQEKNVRLYKEKHGL